MATELGAATLEGVQRYYILDSDVDSLELAYSVTIEKAQGSQFRRVIISARQSRILDRTFVYTAAKRAQVQVILVGEFQAVAEAIELRPRPSQGRSACRLCFRGLAKNTAQLMTLFALSNLWMARRHLIATAGEVRL